METKKAYDLHSEHKEWLKKLAFYKDDLKILQERLEEVNSKNTDKDIRIMIERFQNQFIIQKNELDELNHSINDHETYVENRVNESTTPDKKLLNDHAKERERVEEFEKIFDEMRKKFNGFLSKRM